MKIKCERCDTEMPELSKVCPFCGHINESHSEISLNSAIDKLESCIRSVKRIVSKPFSSYLKKYAWLFFLILSLQFFVLAAVSLNYFVWFMVLLLFGLFIFSLIKLFRENKEQNNLNAVMAEYTSCRNDMVRYFGESRDVKQQLIQTDDELNNLLEKQKTGKFKYNILSLLSIIGILCISGVIILGLSQNIARNDVTIDEEMLIHYLNEEKYEKAIQIFPTVASNSFDEGASAKMQIVNYLMSAGEYDLAISFFYDYCIGKPDDFSYAEVIAGEMLRANQLDKAYFFVDGCTDLYYRSDYYKLINMVNK